MGKITTVTGTETVKSGIAVTVVNESVFGAFAMTGEQPPAFTALLR